MRFYLGIVFAAVVIFFWGFVVWEMLAAPLGVLKPLPKEATVLKALAEAEVASGVYIYPLADADMFQLPGEAKEAALNALDEKAKKGPIVRLFVDTQGRPYFDANMLFVGFLHMLLAAALLATLTRCVLSWADFKARYAFVVAVAVFAAVWVDLSDAIWMASPWNHQLFKAAYDVGAWLLAGVPLAWGTRGDIAK